MRISVRSMEGKEIVLDVDSSLTIQDVKKLIQTKERIRSGLQRLMLGEQTLENSKTLSSYAIHENTVLYLMKRSSQKTTTIAGGWGQGTLNDELSFPYGLTIDDEQIVIVADRDNHRILEWKVGESQGYVVAGGEGQGNGLNQLNCPTDVAIDRQSNSLIICDRGNRRIVRWSRQEGTTEGEVLKSDIACWGITIDHERNIYISDTDKHEVQRYRIGNPYGTTVAGGNKSGLALNQLKTPAYLYIDDQQNLYIADIGNNRVVRWEKDAQKGVIVARGFLRGFCVDSAKNVYIADYGNHCLVRWAKDATEGTVILQNGVDPEEESDNYLPWGVCHDQNGFMYVTDHSNHRVQRLPLNV